ncbi:hypothetical protein NDU88_000455 [Pleurodeles waltl]|uniref:Uncharacterized protein n=1 Tax=Pleurodeles waltl TaxID=8319 RepID=A0AAV7TGU4_PLEWA|nr:hypothetical protein NDU88_000455 [Pleurodeles waltl]
MRGLTPPVLIPALPGPLASTVCDLGCFVAVDRQQGVNMSPDAPPPTWCLRVSEHRTGLTSGGWTASLLLQAASWDATGLTAAQPVQEEAHRGGSREFEPKEQEIGTQIKEGAGRPLVSIEVGEKEKSEDLQDLPEIQVILWIGAPPLHFLRFVPSLLAAARADGGEVARADCRFPSAWSFPLCWNEAWILVGSGSSGGALVETPTAMESQHTTLPLLFRFSSQRLVWLFNGHRGARLQGPEVPEVELFEGGKDHPAPLKNKEIHTPLGENMQPGFAEQETYDVFQASQGDATSSLAGEVGNLNHMAQTFETGVEANGTKKKAPHWPKDGGDKFYSLTEDSDSTNSDQSSSETGASISSKSGSFSSTAESTVQQRQRESKGLKLRAPIRDDVELSAQSRKTLKWDYSGTNLMSTAEVHIPEAQATLRRGLLHGYAAWILVLTPGIQTQKCYSLYTTRLRSCKPRQGQRAVGRGWPRNAYKELFARWLSHA